MGALQLVFPLFFSIILVIKQPVFTAQTTDEPQNGLIPAVQNPHDLIQGDCAPLLNTSTVQYLANRSAVEGGYVRVVDQVTWSAPTVIVCVKLVDRIEDGSGGYPFIGSGGVGYNFVEFGYSSQLSRGIRYLAKIHYRTHP